jgi:hypothetical protein
MNTKLKKAISIWELYFKIGGYSAKETDKKNLVFCLLKLVIGFSI